jgi:signal transduction histidine kinase
MTATTATHAPPSAMRSTADAPRTRRTFQFHAPSALGALVLSLLLVGAIGAGDFVSGVEVPFTMLYLLPIGFGTWFGSRRTGAVVATVSTAFIAASLLHEHELSRFVVWWNVVGAAILMFAASWTIEQLHSFVVRERRQRNMAMEQLRHAERLNVIGTLAAGVAHELGTPLNVIAGCAEILAEESDDPNLHRRTQMILEQVSKVSSIIRHLLEFGHRGGTQRTRADLAEVARSAVEMLRSTARRRGLGIQLEERSVMIEGNVAELEQVLSNLILNALQAMRTGTVYVRTGTAERNGQDVAFVEVEDEGIGIPPENFERIFDPFFTTKDVGEGTGLGLSVSHGIVRDHDGWIEVSSTVGRGSRLRVLLPPR